MFNYKLDANKYYLLDDDDLIQTPMGNPVITTSEILAKRLTEDLNCYGEDPSNPESIVAFHYAMIDFFSATPKEKLVNSVVIGLHKDEDWTLQCNAPDPNALMMWWSIFGRPESQIESGVNWVKGLSLHQLCAVTIIGRALESVNIPFRLSTSIKKKSEMKELINFVERFYPYVSKKELKRYFENYSFYFNIPESPI